MNIVTIADTHGFHHQVECPAGDVLVVAGDICSFGTLEEIKEFRNWLQVQPCPHKIVVAGNHDAPLRMRMNLHDRPTPHLENLWHISIRQCGPAAGTEPSCRNRANDLARRQARHRAYEKEFFNEVLSFLSFHERYRPEAQLFAEKVTSHATPVGSGTVARTTCIPVAKRAEAAVIAWMRHATTAYDSIRIARVKGKRREIRRQLAKNSVELLHAYRQGLEIPGNCPLSRALMCISGGQGS